MSVAVLGAGAFGTALAIALANGGHAVTLHTRDEQTADILRQTRRAKALPDASVPDRVAIAHTTPDANTVLVAVPAQTLRTVLTAADWSGKTLVACCKGIESGTGLLPHQIIARAAPKAVPALLSGPSFAVDIALGLPTALTLAADDDSVAAGLQTELSTPALRLYRTNDLAGTALGGALKNVIAIAAGMTLGAGFGESARAALVTRGFAELTRLAQALGARAETLAGLSGFGDLVLTCTSERSRNFAFGIRLGRSGDTQAIATTEGIATARAALALAQEHNIDTPVIAAVAGVLAGDISIEAAKTALLARPLRAEDGG